MFDVQNILETHAYFENSAHLVDVDGMSTPRVCNLLNQLVRSMPRDGFYLEIGTWKGLTICSAAYDNVGKQCVACDKFRMWGKHTGWGFRAKRALNRNLDRYRKKSAHVMFHHMLSQDLFARRLVPKNVSVYFYDGDHTYEGTYNHVKWAAEYLADDSVLLVDDWNDPAIQKGTRDALREMPHKIVWSVELDGSNGDQSGWWNGLGVFHLRR